MGNVINKWQTVDGGDVEPEMVERVERLRLDAVKKDAETVTELFKADDGHLLGTISVLNDRDLGATACMVLGNGEEYQTVWYQRFGDDVEVQDDGGLIIQGSLAKEVVMDFRHDVPLN